MGGLLKRVQAHAAPVLLIYTVMVTYVLISTAWRDDVKVPGRERRAGAPSGGASFLDVLVQEEKRHMRSFRDVLRSYRNVPRESESSKNTDLETKGDPRSVSPKQDLPWSSAKNRPTPVDSPTSPRRIAHVNAIVKADDTSDPPVRNANSDTNQKVGQVPKIEGGQWRDTSGTLSNDKAASSKQMMVEVEEWDEKNVRKHEKQTQLKKTQPSQLHNSQSHLIVEKSVKPSLVDVKLDSNMALGNALSSWNKTGISQDSDYFLEFCDRVFDDPRIVPNICNRPVIELTNKRHTPVNTASVPFRKIGEAMVYSAFLDVRTGPYVRAMVVAPARQDSADSKYWCFFHTAGGIHQTEPEGFLSTGDGIKGGATLTPGRVVRNAGDNNGGYREATEMFLYAASDGHGRPKQFYISSCLVPEKALSLFSHTGVSTVQVVVASSKSAVGEKFQKRIFLDVIVNKAVDPALATAGSLSYSGVNKTLLVDVASGIRANNSNNSVLDRINKMKVNRNNIRYSVNDYDDDDEDKELAQTNHPRPGVSGNKIGGRGQSKIRAGPGGDLSTLIPHPYRQVGGSVVSCVAPLHGQVSTVQVVEFVELSLLLGVQHLVFYTPSSPGLSEARAALRMYETRGLVTAMPWDLPSRPTPRGEARSNDDDDDLWARGRDVALNDCLYRVLHLFDWALFLDLDEFFVPRVTPDLPSFLAYLQARHRFNASRVTDLVFPSAYFPPPTRLQLRNLTTVPGYMADVSKLASLKSVHRTYFDQRRTLRMVRPDAAFRVGAGERKRTSFVLSTRYAAVHHYSFCPRSESVASPVAMATSDTKAATDICKHQKVDWIMWRYRLVLISRTQTGLRRLNNKS